MIALQKKKMLRMVVMAGSLGASTLLVAQAPALSSDAAQIDGLVTSLSDHAKAPADVLDPTLSPSTRESDLNHFSASKYDLKVVPIGSGPAISGGSASMPVRVHYKAEDGNSLDTNATAQFVRRNGVWYFSNFDFMKWPALLIAILVVCLLVGVAYAATVLVLRSKLIRQGPLGFNGAKMFIPFFWPALFRQTQ